MFLDTSFLKNDEISLVLERTADANEKRGWVPAYHFAIFNKYGVKIGTCDLRVGHNENTYFGGNIGYSVDKEFRGNHYAKKACLLLFELAKKHGLKYLIIICNPKNHASRKTCEYAGGKLIGNVVLPEDNDMRKNGETEVCIYRFEL